MATATKAWSAGTCSAAIQHDGLGNKDCDGSVFAYTNENELILENGRGDSATEFNLSTDGLLQTRNAIIYGKLYDSVSTIVGLMLSNNFLYSGMTSLTYNTHNRVWLGVPLF